MTIDKPIHLELVRVPAGPFLMGDDKHTVDLPEFYIGKYPVTNQQYAAFVQASKARAPDHWKEGKIPAGKENHPVVYVKWDEAVAFCQWLSQASGHEVRLPSQAEWEKAARGADGRTYPWGNEPPPNPDLCNFKDSGIGDTTPVDRYPNGASPYGALDMAGNVWEWTADKDTGRLALAEGRGVLERRREHAFGGARRVLPGVSGATSSGFACWSSPSLVSGRFWFLDPDF